MRKSPSVHIGKPHFDLFDLLFLPLSLDIRRVGLRRYLCGLFSSTSTRVCPRRANPRTPNPGALLSDRSILSCVPFLAGSDDVAFRGTSLVEDTLLPVLPANRTVRTGRKVGICKRLVHSLPSQGPTQDTHQPQLQKTTSPRHHRSRSPLSCLAEPGRQRVADTYGSDNLLKSQPALLPALTILYSARLGDNRRKADKSPQTSTSITVLCQNENRF